MAKRKDIGWLHELALGINATCLSEGYINSQTHYLFRCNRCQYQWKSKANKVQQKRGCPQCAGNIKKNVEHLRELASLKGGKCLSTEYINNHTKYEWECDKEHTWQATAKDVKTGYWCPYCAGNIKKNVEHLHELASLRGGKCLSTEYINNHTKYDWECSQGHGWAASSKEISRGKWCPECSVQNKKNSIEDLHEACRKLNIACLSNTYSNSYSKHDYRCNVCQYEWSGIANNIISGHGCLQCSGLKRKNIEWLCSLAFERGGECLSTKYTNSKARYLFRCHFGHTWETTAKNVRNGHWCPYCFHRHSKAELQIYEFVKQLYPDALNGQRKLLPNPNFELDIYAPSLSKAIEFDGEFWHSLPEVQLRDLQKDQQCQEVGIELLRIQEQYFLDCPQQVFDIIKVFLGS